jgi:multicomponent Na+:H+ antiporter subunit A
MIILATLLLTGGYIFFASGILSSLRVTFEDFPALMILLPVFIVGVAVILFGKSRLFTILALGIIGFAVAFIFILYGAPDLALTQFAIETLTVILFVLVIFKMPKYKPFSKKVFRLRDALIAAATGIFVMITVLLVSEKEMVSELKKFFAAESVPAANGRNIVNVILVDFRALDTFGEITVLAIAAVGVFGLLKLTLWRKEG